MPSSPFEIVWYRASGEHDYEEFRRSPFPSLVAAFEHLVRKYGDDTVFDAITGIQAEIAWVSDVLGFTVEKQGESWNRST